MARKPKTTQSVPFQVSSTKEQAVAKGEVSGATRKGRKGKVADLAMLPEVAKSGPVAVKPSKADRLRGAVAVAPARGRPGRKPRPMDDASETSAPQQVVMPGKKPSGRKLRGDAVAAESNATKRKTSKPASSMTRIEPAGPPSSSKPAAQWDRTTGSVQFDWTAIEQMASQDGPNQGMAKLLIAARAQGANSRWPL